MAETQKKVRIGCASAFWGDTSTAVSQLVEKGKLDYLVLDFLAEVTMSILAGAKMKNPAMGYATDFVHQMVPQLKKIKDENIKIISNAGGINLDACRNILEEKAKESGVDLKIAVVRGDNLIEAAPKFREMDMTDMESGKSFPQTCLSINAYLGAPGIVKALKHGADIVITGRCVDSAMVLAPLIQEFNWSDTDYNLLASGSLAGHIIECGAQCTGGNFTDWKQIQRFDDIGFPIVEVESNGEFTVSKPEDTGGMVSFGTIAEQLLYEIGNPSEYLLPDVVCDFSNVSIEEQENDLVFVKGAKGYPPTDTFKVLATYMHGYRVTGTLVIGGMEAKEKGTIIADAIIKNMSRILKEHGFKAFTDTSLDLIGTDSIYGPDKSRTDSKEIVMRLTATHEKKDALILFSREIAQAVTGMPAGVMNYLGGRPRVSPSIHLFSFLLSKDQISVEVDVNNTKIKVDFPTDGGYSAVKNIHLPDLGELAEPYAIVPLIKLAFARSGDKGDHANIGVIARKPEYLPFIQNALTKDKVAENFSHVLKGEVECWNVPGVHGLNFLLKNSLGGGGMASLNIDPQGKAYAQQLLEFEIPVPHTIARRVQS